MNINTPLFPISADLSTDNLTIKNDGSVAILMRTKNRPILLARAIESVIQQEYSNWHLYLINDGGEAQPIEEIVKLNQTDLQNKITIIHNPDSLGMEAASNCGFRLATEEFLVVHDDDDSWHPKFLLETTRFLQSNSKAVAVITNCMVIHEEIKDNTVKQLHVYEWGYWHDHIDILNLIRGNVTPPICLLIRMKIAKSIGDFNENLPVLGDWDYNLRLFRIGEIKTLNKKLAYYHHRPSANNIYGNSVISGIDKHTKYQIEYRNSLVRELLLNDQGNYGFLHAVLIDNQQTKNELMMRLDHLDQKLNEIQYSVSYLKRKSFPLKRFAGRVRKIIRKVRNKNHE